MSSAPRRSGSRSAADSEAPHRIRGWGKPEFGSGPGQTRNFGVGFARLSRRPPGPGFETSTYFRSPKPGTPPPDSPPGGARPEGGVWVWHWALRSAAPRRGRNSLVAERVCLSLGGRIPPGVAKGPTWRSGKLRGDPQPPRQSGRHRGGPTYIRFLFLQASCQCSKHFPASFTPRGPETGDGAGG